MKERILSGKYSIQREIASGGMGMVYHAIDLTLRREVAIKVLHDKYGGDPLLTSDSSRKQEVWRGLTIRILSEFTQWKRKMGPIAPLWNTFPLRILNTFSGNMDPCLS